MGAATLIIGANLPDIDIFAYLGGPAGDLSFRRGLTHGIPALIVLPLLLTIAIVVLDRTIRRLGRATLPSSVVPSQILALASIAVLTHPILDTLNTYGVRWLMPFSERWFYGDTLFIVDPWLWLILGTGYVLSGERQRSRHLPGWANRPARIALVAATGYVVVMVIAGAIARRITARELTALTGEPVEALMVGPAPISPFVRDVVATQTTHYRAARFHWFRRPHVDPASLRAYDRARPTGTAVDAALSTRLGARFLSWARFPVIELERAADGSSLVHLMDLRYADRPGAGFGAVTIPVAAQVR